LAQPCAVHLGTIGIELPSGVRVTVDAGVDAEGTGTGACRASAMIALAPSTRIFLACGATDMRKGFDGLAVLVQQALEASPHCGALFAFRGKRGDLVKLLWYDGQGLCLYSKRMDRGRFIWPTTKTGKVSLTGCPVVDAFSGRDRLAPGPSALRSRSWPDKWRICTVFTVSVRARGVISGVD
jgi:transposase